MSDRPMFPGEDPGAVLNLRPLAGVLPQAPEVVDALADPAPDLMSRTLFAMLPKGSAWRSPDKASFDEKGLLASFLRSFAGTLSETYRRLFRTAMESTAWSIEDGLADWEVEYGLPDPCLDDDLSHAARWRSLILKVRSEAPITPADFIRLAADAGFVVTIEEPSAFECGQSECGGEDQLGDVEFYWIVRPAEATAFYFECGTSQCGVDALSDFSPNTALECLFRRDAPAWTMPLFDYS